MKCTTTFILFALVFGPSVILAQKGGNYGAALAAANRSPVSYGRKAPPPPPPPQPPTIQQKYEEEEDESALLAAQRQRPAPAPAPAPFRPAPAPFRPPQAAGPIRMRPQPDEPEGPHPAPEPYSFSYSVNDDESGAALTREESQDANGNVVGFYHITDADGRLRRVDYTAGPEGFKAKIQSNEEGLLARDSADAIFDVQAPTAQQQAAVAAQAAAAAAARQRNLGGAAGSTTGRYALAGNRF